MKKVFLLALFTCCLSVAFANVDTIIKIQVVNNQFKPKTVNAKVGDTIRWIWKMGSHTTTSTSVPVGALTWNKPMNSTHLRFTYILKKRAPINTDATFTFSLAW
jgi:plastocyanin